MLRVFLQAGTGEWRRDLLQPRCTDHMALSRLGCIALRKGTPAVTAKKGV